ncbi:hypothetical protein NKDENANG_02423 [Candidatus Entotheonellaceae bacterium PAL068K]
MTIRAPLVIAADGLHSTLGRRLGLIQQVHWLRHVALVTHYAEVRAPRALGEMFLVPYGYIGLAPVSDALMNVSLVLRASQLARAKIKPESLVEATFQAHPELCWRFKHAARV